MFLTCLATNQVVVGCFANTDFLFDKIVSSLVAKQVCGKTRKNVMTDFVTKDSQNYILYMWFLQKPATWLLQDRFDSSVVNSAISLFNLFFRNVAKQVTRFSDLSVLGGGGDGENRRFFSFPSPLTPFPIVFWFELGSAFARLYRTTLEKHTDTHQKNDVTWNA